MFEQVWSSEQASLVARSPHVFWTGPDSAVEVMDPGEKQL